MPKQFSKEMGAIRIFSKGSGQRHREVNLSSPPDNWPRIKASKYGFKADTLARLFGNLSLAQVVESGILDSDYPVLISVHMGPINMQDTDTDIEDTKEKILMRQAKVIEEAKKKGIPIYVTWRLQAERVEKTEPLALLPDALRRAVAGHNQLYYFNGLEGNALEGKGLTSGIKLRDTIRGAGVAIVFGMEYGQCVDSTILGMYLGQKYLEGLLDIGIDVVTARDVLLPGQSKAGTGNDSRYFSFDMQKDIVLNGPSGEPAQTAKISARPSALTAATKAPLYAATDRDATEV